jgi:hypothetical protein
MIMKPDRATLERQLHTNEQKLQGLRSYLKELSAMTDKHGTDKEHFGEDLLETEHNITYYEGEISRIKRELGKSPKTGSSSTGSDSFLPKTPKQGVSSLLFSSIGFVAGAIFGVTMKARGKNKDSGNE